MGFDPIIQTHFLDTFQKACNHGLLQVHTYDAAVGTDHAGQRQAEKSHTTAGFDHFHTRMNVGTEYLLGIFQKSTEGTTQKIAQPPRAYMAVCSGSVLFRFSNCH
jgi:hypothetical protein